MTKENLRLFHALAELAHAECSLGPWDASWPNDRPWVSQVLHAFDDILERARPILDFGELIFLVALPILVASIRKQSILTQLGSGPEELRRTFDALVVSTPMVAQVLEGKLQGAEKFIARWSILRLLAQQRHTWSDDLIRSQSPDVPLARWLTTNAVVFPLVRAVGGEMRQFGLLPDKHVFHFEELQISVRCKLVACMLSLAELRVIGIDLLSPEVVQHIANLPDLLPAVNSQFQHMAVTTEPDGSWMLRGTCDEPVLDHAMNEMAAVLDAELRSHRASMSDYLAAHGTGSFPTVAARPEARTHNGVARYTTPHVSFALSAEHARRLFMGTDLWGDPSLAYRELYQNALDACRYREARSRYLDQPYTPKIRIFHGVASDGREFIECEDNGIGMDRNLIASCFAMAGRRFVNTDEFWQEEAAWRERQIAINVNSQFGIGVFSYFMVADELEVETARMSPDGAPASTRLLLRVPTASSFFRIVTMSPAEARDAARSRCRERGDQESGFVDVGTRVRLTLRKVSKSSDIVVPEPSALDAIKQHVWFAEVETEVRHHGGESYLLGANQLAPWIQSVTETSSEEPRLWWVTNMVRPQDPSGHEITTFRTRKAQNGSTSKYNCLGRVLVDGIATEVTTPGFIVNLRGIHTPQLSLDRRELRSDVSSLLMQRAHAELIQLPAEVSDIFLSDLWTWDPRALHRANARFTTADGSWIRHPPFLNRVHASPTPIFSREYFPGLSPSRELFRRDYREQLLELCEFAIQMPDARDATTHVLEAREVTAEARKNLRFIPSKIWSAWTQVALAVPEAAALACIRQEKLLPLTSAYVSWLTGESISWCEARLRAFVDLADLVYPTTTLSDIAIDDHTAWLLSHGHFSMPWIAERIETFDILMFCTNTRTTIDQALEWYNQLAQALAIPNTVDDLLVRELGRLTSSEMAFGQYLQRGLSSGFRPQSVTDQRAALVAKAVGVALSDEPPDTTPFVGSEHEKGVLRELKRSLDRSTAYSVAATKTAGLDVLCETARALGVSPASIEQDVRSIAARVDIVCTWTTEGVENVATFSDVDWTLIEGDSGWASRKAIRALTARKLGVAIGEQSFWMRQQYDDGMGVHRRLVELYSLFGWGPPPIDVETTTACLKLEYTMVRLLERVPANMTFTIPRLVMLARELGTSIAQLATEIRSLALLGVTGPQDDDHYLGVSWRELAEDTGGEAPRM